MGRPLSQVRMHNFFGSYDGKIDPRDEFSLTDLFEHNFGAAAEGATRNTQPYEHATL
jgi:hypothetical protein